MSGAVAVSVFGVSVFGVSVFGVSVFTVALFTVAELALVAPAAARVSKTAVPMPERSEAGTEAEDRGEREKDD